MFHHWQKNHINSCFSHSGSSISFLDLLNQNIRPHLLATSFLQRFPVVKSRRFVAEKMTPWNFCTGIHLVRNLLEHHPGYRMSCHVTGMVSDGISQVKHEANRKDHFSTEKKVDHKSHGKKKKKNLLRSIILLGLEGSL